MPAKHALLRASLLAALTGLVLATEGGLCVERLLSVRVARFEFHGKNTRARGHIGPDSSFGELPEAVLSLASHAQVRIGLEYLPPSPADRQVPIEVRVRNKTVEEILNLIIAQDPRYEYRERLGVIEVLPVGAAENPATCLNMVIPRFEVHFPWRWAWGQLRCQILLTSRAREGIAAEGPCQPKAHGPVYLPDKLLEATFEGRTVREILDELSSMAGNVAWMASYQKSPPTCENLELGQYQPKEWYPADPDNPNNREYREGLPTKCTKCHYHRP
jgi:hypothetical protein